MNSITIKSFHIHIDRVLLTVQVVLFLVALVSYGYFISASVVQIVLRQELMVSIQEAETNVSKLEATYFENVNKLSRDTAEQYGLVAIEPTAYVHVAPSGDRLTRND